MTGPKLRRHVSACAACKLVNGFRRISSRLTCLETKNGRELQGEPASAVNVARARFFGDLHEGMTAFGSPPAAYGESPQWLVQLILTRSPPFKTGFAYPQPQHQPRGLLASLKQVHRDAFRDPESRNRFKWPFSTASVS